MRKLLYNNNILSGINSVWTIGPWTRRLLPGLSKLSSMMSGRSGGQRI